MSRRGSLARHARAEQLDREVRRAFSETEPEMVGALAALLLADSVEMRLFDLLGEEAFECPQFSGRLSSTGDRAERVVALAGTPFAMNVARLCRFAQTGELDAGWGPGWWREPPEPLEAARHTAAVLLQALLVRPLGSPSGYEDGWWTDPGPIDVNSATWELVATLHLARERLLDEPSRAPLPVRAVEPEVLSC